tara:strand:- start:4660 stop:4842 length:183 start_codon:yes stop_codon:yes gene_type:complete
MPFRQQVIDENNFYYFLTVFLQTCQACHEINYRRAANVMAEACRTQKNNEKICGNIIPHK